MIILIYLLFLIGIGVGIFKYVKKEYFSPGIGKSFGMYYKPCLDKDTILYKGSYLRSQLYQNMCEPEYGGILKIPIQLNDNCFKKFN